MTRTDPVHAHGGSRDRGNPLGAVAGDLGRGLVAGLLGTAVLTAVQKVEMEVQGRGPSTMPADAVKKVFGLRTRDEAAEQRLARAAHWGYGIAWGGLRGLLGSAGLGGVSGTLSHFLLVWGAALALLPALDLSEPPTEWDLEQLATDAGHHAAFAAAVGAAFTWLDR